MNKSFNQKPSFSDAVAPYVFKLPLQVSSRKDERVETLRGLTIILVVFGHMIAGMQVDEDSIFRYIHYSLGYIRMPLFTVISGWVYATKPVRNIHRTKFITGKLRRLILPMFVITTLLFLLRMIVPGTNHSSELGDLPLNLILPYDVYWYLYSLFLIFLLITVLDVQPFFHRIEGWSIALLSSFAFLYLVEQFLPKFPNLFSFKGAAYLLPFFLVGIGIFRFKNFLLSDKLTLIVTVVSVAGIIIQQLTWFGYFPIQERNSLLGMTVGTTTVLLLFRLRLRIPVLMWLGSYAYGIFLFHVFFTGGSRILFSEIENEWLLVGLGVLCGVLFSVVTEMLISRVDFLRFAFLGLKRHEK